MPGYVVGDLGAIDVRWMEAHTAESAIVATSWKDSGISIICSPRPKPPAAREPLPRASVIRPRTLARYGTMESPLGVLLIATNRRRCVRNRFRP